MSLQDYYNVLPASHKSPAPSPTSSEDSGIPIEESGVGITSAPPPARPPRARDEPVTHEYHNLPPFGHDYQNTDDAFFGFRRRAMTPPPPRLPKRQPTLARPKTPPPPVIRRPHNIYSNNNNNSFSNNRNPAPMTLLQQHPHLTARSSSVSSSASTVASTANSQQPFRRRFQVRKKRTGGSCKCKAPAGRVHIYFYLNPIA